SAKTVLQRSEYEPYGFLANRPMQDGPGYTGHITDAATGLVYMQQRYYDPMIPRFLSVDPVTAYDDPIGAFHRYRYANNNPYRFVDPDGRRSDEDGGPESCDAECQEKIENSRPNGCNRTRECYYDFGRDKWITNRFDWTDAVSHWRHGNGSAVAVYASQLNLTKATYRKNPDGTYLIHTYFWVDTGVIYGTVTAELDRNSGLSFMPDTYNFDIKNPFAAKASGDRWRLMRRNGATALGLAIHGFGERYRIFILGTAPFPEEWEK